MRGSTERHVASHLSGGEIKLLPNEQPGRLSSITRVRMAAFTIEIDDS